MLWGGRGQVGAVELGDGWEWLSGVFIFITVIAPSGPFVAHLLRAKRSLRLISGSPPRPPQRSAVSWPHLPDESLRLRKMGCALRAPGPGLRP